MKTIYKKLLLSVLLLPFSVLAQSTLTGTVTDKASGQPLPGVSVVVQGTTNGTSTDFDGKFSLSGLKNGQVVVFSFIGYKEVSETFTGQKSVAISLAEETNELTEVVVQIGYGSVRKKDATGSVTQLSSKEFNKGANVTAENLLAGRVAGVTVNLGGGAPGSGAQIRIRGGSSLSASNDPLIVIDGLPITNNRNEGSTSILASLNPNDIESFNILKDASATAIYGSRAANGVIIINTKRGSKKLSVDYNFQYGSGNQINQIEVMNASQFTSFLQSVSPAFNPANPSAYITNRLGVPDPNAAPGTFDDPTTPQIEGRIISDTNWQDEIYRRTDFVDNNLSIRGSLFNVVPAKLTLNNTFQEGLRLTNTFQRTSTSLALNPRLFKDHLKINFSANYVVEKNRFADGVEGTAIRFDPTKPVRYEPSAFSGFFEYQIAGPSGALPAPQSPRNPVAQLLQTDDQGRQDRVFGNLEFDYKFHFLPELRAVVNLGYDQAYSVRTLFRSANGVATADLDPTDATRFIGRSTYLSQRRTNKLLDGYLAYNKTFGKVNIDATAGYSYQVFTYDGYNSGNMFDLTANRVPVNFADPDVVLVGYFGRANFTFNDKYILTASFRRDGTSRFSEDNRWGFFPAAAFAWKMKEDFFKDSNTVSDLKLRLGYGVSGQQDINAGDFYLARYNVGFTNSQYNIGGTNFQVGVPQSYNPDLKWETTTTYNAGIDYGFFGNRINGAVDVFYKLTEDLFFAETPFADGSNFGNQGPANIGSFSTKGIEFSINADIVRGDSFNWNVNFNVTRFERRIEELVADSDILTGSLPGGIGGRSGVHREGFTPFSFLMYKQLYDTTGRPIEGAFADLNADGIINENDRYIYKNPDPDATFGFSSNLNYKNFDFSFFMRASIGNRVFNQVNAGRAYSTYALSADAQLSNIPTSYFDNEFSIGAAETILSDLYIENGSFLRMDNITLGYTFPKWLDGKASLRLFTGCQNAFIITKYSGLDPEINNEGIDNTIYPRQRQFLFGANVKF
ncbi:SusC/RagA family TonB-linked outer membrane protein [Flavobacterium aurantiibacter]|uniref:SusC/RagA family TonB-linked outer membrane protein n=1 Tax=Flavobacterium aurantiibacter TaxID=2023067 RepID=A0A255ZL34_9FLAO|nr:TonB-dependent receptor [Flavobacterium aurantiibacter]OYQ42243.1 SusC/RagA family TonB-linked outer membrane protein [Flavobacterium aurantiibacter]